MIDAADLSAEAAISVKRAVGAAMFAMNDGPHPRFLLGHLLHITTTLIFVIANLSPVYCHVFAGNLGEKPCRPNIVLILADDLGWGDVAYNGNKEVKTPTLDELARTGVRFDRFYAAYNVCSPTRRRPSPPNDPILCCAWPTTSAGATSRTTAIKT